MSQIIFVIVAAILYIITAILRSKVLYRLRSNEIFGIIPFWSERSIARVSGFNNEYCNIVFGSGIVAFVLLAFGTTITSTLALLFFAVFAVMWLVVCDRLAIAFGLNDFNAFLMAFVPFIGFIPIALGRTPHDSKARS